MATVDELRAEQRALRAEQEILQTQIQSKRAELQQLEAQGKTEEARRVRREIKGKTAGVGRRINSVESRLQAVSAKLRREKGARDTATRSRIAGITAEAEEQGFDITQAEARELALKGRKEIEQELTLRARISEGRRIQQERISARQQETRETQEGRFLTLAQQKGVAGAGGTIYRVGGRTITVAEAQEIQQRAQAQQETRETREARNLIASRFGFSRVITRPTNLAGGTLTRDESFTGPELLALQSISQPEEKTAVTTRTLPVGRGVRVRTQEVTPSRKALIQRSDDIDIPFLDPEKLSQGNLAQRIGAGAVEQIETSPRRTFAITAGTAGLVAGGIVGLSSAAALSPTIGTAVVSGSIASTRIITSTLPAIEQAGAGLTVAYPEETGAGFVLLGPSIASGSIASRGRLIPKTTTRFQQRAITTPTIRTATGETIATTITPATQKTTFFGRTVSRDPLLLTELVTTTPQGTFTRTTTNVGGFYPTSRTRSITGTFEVNEQGEIRRFDEIISTPKVTELTSGVTTRVRVTDVQGGLTGDKLVKFTVTDETIVGTRTTKARSFFREGEATTTFFEEPEFSFLDRLERRGASRRSRRAEVGFSSRSQTGLFDLGNDFIEPVGTTSPVNQLSKTTIDSGLLLRGRTITPILEGSRTGGFPLVPVFGRTTTPTSTRSTSLGFGTTQPTPSAQFGTSNLVNGDVLSPTNSIPTSTGLTSSITFTTSGSGTTTAITDLTTPTPRTPRVTQPTGGGRTPFFGFPFTPPGGGVSDFNLRGRAPKKARRNRYIPSLTGISRGVRANKKSAEGFTGLELRGI